MFPKTATTQDIQRRYRSIFDEVMEQKEPVVVMVNNMPQVVIVEFHQFEELQKEEKKRKMKLAMKVIQKQKFIEQIRFEKLEAEVAELLITLKKQGKLKKSLEEQLGVFRG